MSFLRTLFCQDCGHKSDQNYSRIQIKAPHRLLHVKTKLGLNQFSEQQKQKALPSPPSKSRWHAVCLWHLTGNIESAEKIIIWSRFGVEYKLHTESMNSLVVQQEKNYNNTKHKEHKQRRVLITFDCIIKSAEKSAKFGHFTNVTQVWNYKR